MNSLLKKDIDSLLESSELEKLYSIEKDDFEKFDVKRGLRNADGSGVLAGLTHISSVVGREKIETGFQDIEGILKYRGIVLEDLVAALSDSIPLFEQGLLFLLLGEKINQEEQGFLENIRKMASIPLELQASIQSLPVANLMNAMQVLVAQLSRYEEVEDVFSLNQQIKQSLKLIVQFPVAVAYAYLSSYSYQPQFLAPNEQLGIAENFLVLLRQGQAVTKLESQTLDLCLFLHAEHGGGNNSSFATHVVSSSGANLHACIVAAIGALSGPLHGAANQKVMDMMDDIKKHVKNWKDENALEAHLSKILKGEACDGQGKLYGLGHAVYTKSDPRARLLKIKAAELAKEKGREAEFDLYCKVAELGPKAFYALKGESKCIAPNVDFYSGFVYDCLGIPRPVYTPMFAMARIVGWCTHRLEEIVSGKRIIRPAYKYVQTHTD